MSDHKRQETTRQVVEYICKEPTCQFFDEPIQQGVCHSDNGDLVEFDRLADASLEFARELKEIRAHYTDRDEYIGWLEAMYECVMMNLTFTLDECIRLRRDIALLKKG